MIRCVRHKRQQQIIESFLYACFTLSFVLEGGGCCDVLKQPPPMVVPEKNKENGKLMFNKSVETTGRVRI